MKFMVLMNAFLGATFPMVRRYFWRRAAVLPDFGRGHPDPYLTSATNLVKEMGSGEYGMGWRPP